MKLHAGIWKGTSGRWWVDIVRREDWDPTEGTLQMHSALLNPSHDGCATHAEAVEYALLQVGLATPPEHREAP